MNEFMNYVTKKNPLALVFLLYIGLHGICNVPTIWNGVQYVAQQEELLPTAQVVFFEQEYTEQFVGKDQYIDLNGRIFSVVGSNYLNEVLKLDNGYFITLDEEEDMTHYVDSATLLYHYLQEREIPFAFIQAPGQLPSDFDENIPDGFETYINRNADAFLNGLESNGVPTLDLRAEIQNQGLNHWDLFFKTDHHWNAEGGLWGSSVVAPFIDQLLGEDIANPDYFDQTNYQITTYPKAFLGSRGQRTGAVFSGYDDVSIFTPRFETQLEGETASSSTYVSGDFTQVMYPTLDVRNLTYQTYLSYLGDYSVLKNHKVDNGKKIVILRDSFSRVAAAFLALHYEEIHLFDFREGDNTNDFFLQQLEVIAPDVVVQMLYTGANTSEELFSYGDAILRLQEGT